MNKILQLTLIFSMFSTSLLTQDIPLRLTYPDTLWSTTDTFYVQGTNWDKEWSFSTSQSDTIDLGTDGFEGVKMNVWTDKDTVTVPYVNFPFEQWLYIPIASLKDTAIYRLRFNQQSAVFNTKYVHENQNTSSFTIPETYELANIILYLTDCSIKTNNQKTNTAYSNKINDHFTEFKNHPIVKILNQKCSNGSHWTTYYGFRENSICFKFDENNVLKYDTHYKQVMYDNSDIIGGEFRNLLYLVQDFADKTNFRKFYQQNVAFYTKLEARQAELQPVSTMWKWLENEFPQLYDSYKVVFSPLIIGSHSTQKFHKGFYKDPEYQECVMFVNSSESVDQNTDYTEKMKEGLMSGIVFTEIDHNYVNPTSLVNIKAIKELIDFKDSWASKEAQKNYSSDYAIFNEYMTHSLFCLYIEETFQASEKVRVIDKRVELMESRGFSKFQRFNSILVSTMKDRELTIFEAYPALISKMTEIK